MKGRHIFKNLRQLKLAWTGQTIIATTMMRLTKFNIVDCFPTHALPARRGVGTGL